jgi:hypothetical protein
MPSGERVKPTVSGVLLFATVTIASVASAQVQDPPSPSQARVADNTDAESSTGRRWPPFGIALGPGVRDLVPVGDATSAQANLTVVALFIRSGGKSGLVPGAAVRSRPAVDVARGCGRVGLGNAYLRTFMAGAGWAQPIAGRLSTVQAFTLGYSWNGVDSTDNPDRSMRFTVPTAVASTTASGLTNGGV